MERLFSPCTRLHDLLQNDGLLDDIEYDDSDNAETVKELNLEFLGGAAGLHTLICLQCKETKRPLRG
jgi:hypothetical protein